MQRRSKLLCYEPWRISSQLPKIYLHVLDLGPLLAIGKSWVIATKNVVAIKIFKFPAKTRKNISGVMVIVEKKWLNLLQRKMFWHDDQNCLCSNIFHGNKNIFVTTIACRFSHRGGKFKYTCCHDIVCKKYLWFAYCYERFFFHLCYGKNWLGKVTLGKLNSVGPPN